MKNNYFNTSVAKESLAYKLYTIGQISAAAYLGGPIAGCYLMSVNFKHLNNEEIAKKTLLIGIITTMIFFPGLFFIPEKIIDQIPEFLIPMIYTSIIGVYAKKLQGKRIKEHIEKGGQKYSGWKVAGIVILFSILTLVYFFAYGIFLHEKILQL